MLWLCMYFPNLPLDIFTRHQSHHFYKNQGGGQAICEQQRVISADSAAITAGIQLGMSVNTAYALSDTLQVNQRDQTKEQQALQEVAYWAYEITPAINLYSENSLMLEISGVLKLFGGLEQVLSALATGLSNMGYNYQYGLAHTPKAAHLVAATAPNNTDCFDKQAQRFNTSLFKSHLNTLPLTTLNQPEKIQKKFTQLGLKTVGELMSLPISAIGKRFGSNFLRYFAELRGEISDPQTFIKPPESFARSFFFNHSVEHVGALRFPMKRLIGELCGYLQQHQWRSESIQWRLLATNGAEQTIDMTLHNQASDQNSLFDLSQLRFEKLQLTNPIEQISLHCRQFTALTSTNHSLFKKTHNKNKDISNLKNKLNVKLGSKNVYQLQTNHSHIPEHSNSAINHMSNSSVSQLDLALEPNRPTWLLPKPEPIEQTQNGLFWRGKLTILDGPERIESHWQQHTVARDYFTARHESGETYWIFHNQKNQQWFAHGVFS